MQRDIEDTVQFNTMPDGKPLSVAGIEKMLGECSDVMEALFEAQEVAKIHNRIA